MARLLALGGVVAGSVLLVASAADTQPATHSIVDAGRQVYVSACAACHGSAATGYGPTSWILEQQTPDLTRYSDRTVPFPRENLRNIITGRIRRVPGPVASKMPLWRASFDGEVPGHGVTYMDALLAYLDDIQLRKFGPYEGPSAQTVAAAGRRLFQTHCVTCHGDDGRGLAPSQYRVGIAIDLTTIASRNNGVFELRQVFESIARCDDDDRQRAMPSWRRTLRRAGWGEYLTTMNLEALATYVESLQR